MRQDATVRRIHRDLPIFRIDAAGRTLIYTPGRLLDVSAEEAHRLQCFWEGLDRRDDPSIRDMAARIADPAGDAASARRRWLEEPYMPECLTVYLSNACNLACLYCFSAGGRNRPEAGKAGRPLIVNKTIVYAAARLVATNCAAKDRPFVLVLNGGGEPMRHWGLVKDIVGMTRDLAREFGIPWFGYIATNGVMPEARALWLGRHFDIVGLSCDGPPDIQDLQRPLNNGGKSSPFVERTARLIQDAGGRIEIRATITPETVERQEEIVSYVCRELGASTVRLEPVYCGRTKNGHLFIREDADRFAAHFLAAQDLADSLGGTLSLPGVRMDEVHGPYCDVLRNVLRLTPGGAATACFFSTDSGDPTGNSLQIGRFDEAAGNFSLDMDRIDTLRQTAGSIPDTCRECIISYSCSRSCPDACPVLPQYGGHRSAHPDQRQESAEFRCLIHQNIALARLIGAIDPRPICRAVFPAPVLRGPQQPRERP